MKCRTCGAPVPPVISEFGGVTRTIEPEICHACRVERTMRVEAATQQAQLAARLDLAGIPAGVTVFDSFLPMVRWVLSALESRTLVWVSGPVRSGRTTMAAAVALEWMRQGRSARYDHASCMGSKEGWQQGRDLWACVDLLAIDGMFSTRASLAPWLLDEFDGLLQRRSDAGRRTLVTSGRSLVDVGREVDLSLANRMLDMVGDAGCLVLPPRGGVVA